MALMPLAFIGLVLAVGGIVLAVSERRLRIARGVVRQMAMVTTQNIPLGTGLMLAGEGERGAAGTILRQIAGLIGTGWPLSEAMAQGYPRCPGLVRSVIQAGEQAGRLPAVLRMLAEDLDDRARRRSKPLPLGIAYACLLLIVLGLILTGVMVVIMPKFREIFNDFGVELPGLTRALIGISAAAFATSIGWLLPLGLLVVIPLGLHWAFRPRRFERPRLTSEIADHLRWVTPGLGGTELASGLASIASLLRLFAGAGMTLERAAALAAETDVNVVLRYRVREFVHLLGTGTPPPDAAEQAGLGPVLTSALRAGQHGDRLDASLGFAADYYRSISSRFWIVIHTIAWPVITLCMAAIVGAFVTALFVPLVSLIEAVIETV